MITYKKDFGQDELDAVIDIYTQSEHYKKALTRQRLILLIGACVLFAISYFLDMTLFGAIVFVALMVCLFRLTPINKKTMRKNYNKADSRLISGMREYVVDDNGISITNPMASSHLSWDAMESFGEYKQYIYIRRIDQQCCLFDKTLMTGDEVNELIQLLCIHNIKKNN